MIKTDNTAMLRRYETMRNRAKAEVSAQVGEQQDALQRRFAQLGNLSSGAAMKQQSLTAERGAQLQQRATEGLDAAQWMALCADPAALANRIKALPLRLTAPRPIDEAISSAGGVRLEAMDAGLMLSALPGVFCAGEMLDWEAPTGGYLLQASFASGVAAAHGALAWIGRPLEA